jgi:hypothetical protein
MTAEQLARATKKYEAPFGGWEEFKPLTAKDRQIHRLARRRGRPRIGRGAAKVYISMEKDLLKEADSYARKHGMSRSELIATGVRAVIGSAA